MPNQFRPSRAALAALATTVLMGAVFVGSGPATSKPDGSTSARAITEAVPAVPIVVARPSAGPGPGQYSAPEWLPLHRNVNGGEFKVGCTYNSRGSQFGYGCGGHHSRWALDLIADAGTPVYAAGKGFAVNATGQGGSSGYGNVVKIDHGMGVTSLYAHLSKVEVPAQGMWVDQATEIGKVGSTGSSSANHLHYEKQVAGAASPVDPGPLKACAFGVEVSYPAIRGYKSWYGIAWGAFTLFSDGTDCPTPAERAVANTYLERVRTRQAFPKFF